MGLDTSVPRRACLGCPGSRLGLAGCSLGLLGYIFLTEEAGLDSFAGGIALFLLGILTVALLAVGCAFGPPRQARPSGGLACLSWASRDQRPDRDNEDDFSLLGPFGIPGLTLAFLVVADRRVRTDPPPRPRLLRNARALTRSEPARGG